MSAFSNPLSGSNAADDPLANPLSSSANAGRYDAGDTIDTIDGEMGQLEEGLYWVITSRAKGDASSPFGGSATANKTSQLVQMTEEQIRQEYQDSGQLQDTFGSFDSYMGYINDSQDFVQSAEWMTATPEYRIGSKEWAFLNGEDLAWKPGEREQIQQKIIGDRVAARTSAFEQWMGSEAGSALMQKYGIEPEVLNDDGDKFKWTGSGYQKTYKVDDHASVADYGKMAIVAALGVAAGPALTGALTGTLGAAGAKAASSAIINLASQYMTTGELDWKDALISAATSYGGAKLGGVLEGSGALGSIGEKISDVTDKFSEVLAKTGDIGSAAIKAGGMSLLTQLVTTGEVDIKTAGIAALVAGGTTAFQEWTMSMSDAGIEADEYMQDLAEHEEFQQAAIDADLKDPFLNPNYETVGDGLIINIDTGNVYGYGSDESLGAIDDLDLDGDGMLSGDDLQNITTPDRELVDPIIRPDNNFGYELGDTVYVDANGNPVDPGMVKFGANGYTYMGEPVEATTYDQVFGGDKGGLKWEFGINEDGSVSTTDGVIRYENGELAYEKIDGQWQDADGNIIDDPAKVDELTLIAAKEIDAPLESVEYFDQDGNPITYKYAPHGLRDNLEQGQFSGLIFGPNGEVQEVWYDPQTGTEYIKSEQGFQEVNRVEMPEPDPVEPEQVEPEQIENNDSSANADPNDSTDAGEGDSGGGETDSTGGSGASGSVGGGGTTGGGAPAGGSSGGSSNDAVVDINNPLAGGNVSEDNTVNDDTVADPSDGTGTPVAPPMNAQIEALMKRGMSYEEAVANQNAAISAGADANSDGMVTNAEWAAHSNGLGGDGGSTGGTDTGSGTGGAGGGSGSGSGSTGGGDVGAGTGTGTGGSGSGSGDSGNTAGGNGTGGGLGNGGGSGPGTGGGTNGGTGPGGSTGAGTGSGTEPGSGGGAGGGGVGGPPGNGAGMLGGSGDNSNPTWGPLFPGKQFQKFEKRRSGVIQSLFEDLMK